MCKELCAIDPDISSIEIAQERKIENATFAQWNAQNLAYSDQYFDMVIFTLSFHHIPEGDMARSIDEAIRVVKKWWYIVFFEPTEDGTFFEAEILFDACDGDERIQKRNSHDAIMCISRLQKFAEFYDETVFQFESELDFIENLHPKKNIANVAKFLMENNYILNADRWANIFQSL